MPDRARPRQLRTVVEHLRGRVEPRRLSAALGDGALNALDREVSLLSRGALRAGAGSHGDASARPQYCTTTFTVWFALAGIMFLGSIGSA